MENLQRLRVATALAHSVPDASLTLTWTDGSCCVVSHDTGSPMNLCELRHLVAGAYRFRADPFVSAVQQVDLRDGLVHIGAGLYSTGCPLVSRSRWMTTFLPPEEVRAVIEGCPVDHESLSGRIVPDCALGVTVICIDTPTEKIDVLETAAVWTNSELLVAELTRTTRMVGDTGPAR